MLHYFLLACLSLSSFAIAGEGLNRLLQGNMRYIKDELEHPHRDAERRESLVSKQEPFAVVIGCSDSRVSPEIIFDQGVGDLFVIRVAGNVVGPIELSSVEYAAVHLHSSVILVLGHEHCGAVDAVVQKKGKEILPIAELIEPVVQKVKKEHPKHLLTSCIKENALHVRNQLLTTPVLKKLIEDGKIEIHAAYYNLENGKVNILQ